MQFDVMLDAREKERLTELSQQMDMSEGAILRNSLRLYDLFRAYVDGGCELAFRQPDGKYVRPMSAGPKLVPWSPDESQS